MTPIDSTTIEPVNQDDPELRVAALNSLGLAAGMTTSVLRSVLLKRLADDEFVPDDSTTTAMLLLEKANVSNAQLADVFESVALTKLQVLRANFPTWSPAERRQHWDDLQRYVSHVPYLARQLTALRPGLEWVPPDLASVSPVVYQIVEQTIILFSLSPMQRIAARAEYFSKSPLSSQEWSLAVEEALDRQGKYFQLVPEYERSLRSFRSAAEQPKKTVQLHKDWTPTKEPRSWSFGNWPWWPVAFLVIGALRLFGTSNSSTPPIRPLERLQPTITMPQDVSVNIRLKAQGINLGDLVLGRRIGSWPSEDSQSTRRGLGLFLQQREALYKQPGGIRLTRTQVLQELEIFQTLLEKYDELPPDEVDSTKIRPKVSIPLLRTIASRLKDFTDSEGQEFHLNLPLAPPDDSRAQEALEKLLGRKAPVINGVDLAEQLDLTRELANPDLLGQRLRERAEAYQKNPVITLTPLQLKREIQQLERLLSAYAELRGKDVVIPEDTMNAARSLQIIGLQLQNALDKTKDASPGTSSENESER